MKKLLVLGDNGSEWAAQGKVAFIQSVVTAHHENRSVFSVFLVRDTETL